MKEIFRKLLLAVGEDPKREGLIKTPQRAAEAWRDLTCGYSMEVKKVLNGAIFHENVRDMILVRDIEFYSLCEHHLLPFFGRCHLAYIPLGKIIGLSKVARVVDLFARRLQVQERLTEQIADTIMEALQPMGVAVVMEAEHLCMQMRGVEKQNSVTVTSAMLGVFRKSEKTRMEFLELLQGRRPLKG